MFKAHLLAPVLLLVAGSFVAGCSNADTASPMSTSDPITQGDLLADHVEVTADRLTFEPVLRAARSREFSDLVARITTYEDAVRKAETEAPATLRSGSPEKDEWVVEHLLQQKIKPVILVGKRNSQARNADGSIRTDVKNAYGYLRRAVGVVDDGGGELVILTKPASIIEANEELQRLGLIDARDMKRTGNATPQGAGDDDNWHWEKNYPYSLTDLDLSRTLYERNIGAGIGRVTVRLKDSHLRVNGNLDAMAAGRWVRPREAHAILTTNIDGQLIVEGAFDGAFGASSGNIEVYRKSFDIAAVGGFPLTFDFEIVAKCDLASNGKVNAQVGMRVDGGIRAGATYVRDQGFDTLWEPRWPAFSPVGPTLTTQATVEGRCGITATTRIHLFDALGPEATAGTFVAIEAGASSDGGSGSAHAKMIAGIDATLAGTFKPFGVNLGSISVNPFHKEWVLFDEPVRF